MNILQKMQQQFWSKKTMKKMNLDNSFSQKNLKTICNMYNSLLGSIPQYADHARPKLISAIQDDIKTFIKNGTGKADIVTFYDISEFKKLWSRLNLTQNDLEIIIDSEFENNH